MKELSIEEKAKAYDEALSVAQETYTTQPMYRDWLAKMFPELKESKDEKIRKEIINFIKISKPEWENYSDYSSWIAWLEKQKSDKFNDEKDEKIRNALIRFHKSTIDVDGIKGENIIAWLEKQGEQMSDPRYSILNKLIEADDIYQMSVNDTMVEEAKNKAIETLSKLEISKLLGLEKQGGITKLSEEEQNRFAKGVLSNCAMSFIDYLDAHNCEGKMCVSNGDCADIENAFHNGMWDKLHRYYCKYIEKQDKQIIANSTKTCKDEQKTVEWHREDEQNLNACLGYIPDEYLRRWLMDIVHVKYDKPADKVEPKFKVGDTIKCKYDDRQFTIKSVNLDKGTYTYTQEGCGNDIDYADEEFELVEQKPVEEYNITGIGSKNAQGKLGEMIKNLKHINEVLEQNHTDKVEPKFKVGDWVIFNEHHNSVYQVEKIDNYRYYLRHYLGGTLSIRFDSELIRKWTLQDAKSGDVLASNSSTFLFSQEYMGGKPEAHCGIMNGFFIVKPKGCWTNEKCYPATKEQRDVLFAKMKEAGYEWDDGKKKLEKIEQKSTDKTESTVNNYITPNKQFFQWIYDRLINVHNENPNVDYMLSLKERIENMQKTAWSEEDEDMLDNIIDDYDDADEHNLVDDIGKVMWLKSIKERVACEANCTTTKQWSEDEESIINKAESWLDTLCDYLKDSSSEYISDIKDVINKLKSLKDRIGG